MKRSILFSLMMIGAAVALVGGGTFAYFSDNGNSTTNLFTSGTLDVQLSNDGTGLWYDNVSGTWVSPAGWAPGDTFEAVLKFRNVGSVAAHSGLIDFQYGGCVSGNIFPKVEVLSYKESYDNGVTYPIENINPTGPGTGLNGVFDANGDGKLSLWELINGDAYLNGTQSPSPYDLAIYTPQTIGGGDGGAWGNGGTSAGELDVLPFGNPDILPANGTGVYAMKMQFKFMEDAGSAYQGLSCTMDIQTKFVQVPGVRPWNSLVGW
jgi:predicted ribosomally synthesized peptide with SipW-like signal peptide